MPDEMVSDDVAAIDRAIVALEAQREVLGAEVVETALRPLVAQRDRLTSRPVEQRKLVTSLFSDVVDSTPLTSALGAETMREVMNRYFVDWRRAIEAEGGVVEKFIGDAVVGVFGTVRAREDDPHRAVRAALRMQEPLARLDAELHENHGVNLQMRVGIDTGEVVLGVVGERGDDDIVVVGESLNRAARLQAAAPVGGILLSPDTARQVRGSFALQRLDGLALKGFDASVDAYLVHSAAPQVFWPQARGIEGVTARTVGRDVELGRLRKAFADMPAEECWSVVTVLGEAGIGKSRLLADFERWLAELPSGVWLLRGRSGPNDESVPHGLLRSVFSERFGLLETDGPDVVRAKWRDGVAGLLTGEDTAAPRDERSGGRRAARRERDVDAEALATWLGFGLGDLPQLDAWRSDPAGLQRQARAALDELLRRMSASAPVVLLLEDLHWADGASLDWLQDATASPPDYAVLVVASARPTLLERRPHWAEGLRGHVTLRLDPLTRRDSADLVGELLQHAADVPESLRRLLVDAGEGNPFYIEELLAWLIGQGVVTPGPDGWSVADAKVAAAAVPGTLRGVLQARLDGVAPDERDLIDRASVIGRVFWDRAVDFMASAGDAGDADAYRRLRRRELVHQRPTSTFEDAQEFSFRHALLRDVAYDGLLRPRRRRLHALAAQWLAEAVERTGRADEHAVAVAQHLLEGGERAAASRWFLRAGRHAASSYASEQALDLLEQAERNAPPDEPDLRFDVLAERELVLDRLGRREPQRATLDEMARLAGDDPVRRTRALTAEGRWLFYHADYRGAAAVAGEAVGHAVLADRPDLEVPALLVRGRSLAFRSDHAAARAFLEGLLPRAREVGSRRDEAETLRLLGVVATNLHEEGAAVSALDEAVQLFRRAGDREGEALAAGQLGALLLLTGHLEAAREMCESALEIFVASGHRLRQGIVLGNLVSIAIEQGRLDDALRIGLETLALTRDVEDPEGVASSLLRLGEASRLVGDLAAARSWLEQSVALGVEHELDYFVAFAHFSLVLTAMTEENGDAVHGHLAAAREAARRSEVPAVNARATLLEGLVRRADGDVAAAVESLRSAVAQVTLLGLPADVRECRACLAGSLLDAGQADEAADIARDLAASMPAGDEQHGGIEPGLDLLECHRVLSAVGDPAAADVAAAARHFLDLRAGLLADTSLREGFLATEINQRLAAVGGRVSGPGPR